MYVVSHPVNELPGLALIALLAGTVLALTGGVPASASGMTVLALAALTVLGLLAVTRRGPWQHRWSSGRWTRASAAAGDRWPGSPAGHGGTAWPVPCSRPCRCGR